MDHNRSNVTDLHIFKEWQQFHINQILFIFQSGQLQPGAAVLHIVLDQSRKQDIWILCTLCQKVTFPFYSLFFGRKPPFAFVLTLSKPIISTVVLLFAVNRWNSWFNEFIYLTDKKLHPLQLVIRSIVLTGESEGALQAGEVVLGQSLKYAVVILAMIPMLILYPLIQKYLVKGIMLGAVKG